MGRGNGVSVYTWSSREVLQVCGKVLHFRVLPNFAVWPRLVGKRIFVSLSQWDLLCLMCALALQPFPLSLKKSGAQLAKSLRSLSEQVFTTNLW